MFFNSSRIHQLQGSRNYFTDSLMNLFEKKILRIFLVSPNRKSLQNFSRDFSWCLYRDSSIFLLSQGISEMLGHPSTRPHPYGRNSSIKSSRIFFLKYLRSSFRCSTRGFSWCFFSGISSRIYFEKDPFDCQGFLWYSSTDFSRTPYRFLEKFEIP